MSLQPHNRSTQSVWRSPAKLNLFLHIIGRRQDGYHLLQTVFQLIDLCDELEFDIRDDSVIKIVDQVEGVSEQDNLVWRAAALLQGTSSKVVGQSTPGVNITLRKQLPMGGGLGGGSSNAATTLVALNCLWNTGLTIQQLADLGLQLGADVPVFVHGYSAWGEGVGENLQPIELPPLWFIVVHPGVHVSTEKLFLNSELTRDSSPITIRDFRAGERVVNVFQELVCSQQPLVSKALTLLTQAAASCGVKRAGYGVGIPALTGTGSCVFLACRDEQTARSVLRAVVENAEFYNSQSDDKCGNICAFIARGLNESPLKKKAEASNRDRPAS